MIYMMRRRLRRAVFKISQILPVGASNVINIPGANTASSVFPARAIVTVGENASISRLNAADKRVSPAAFERTNPLKRHCYFSCFLRSVTPRDELLSTCIVTFEKVLKSRAEDTPTSARRFCFSMKGSG